MKTEIEELSKYRIEKAKSDLESSEIMFLNNKFAQSLNRSYYAMFHATRALLALDKFDSKKHSGIISFFNQNYIKTKKIETQFGQMLMAAEKIRIESDYDDFYVATKQQTEVQLANAKNFVLKIEKYLKVFLDIAP